MPSIKTTMTTGSYKSASDPRLDDAFPLGQLPQGDDEFDAALKKLDNTFNVLVDRLNALEGSLKVLQETNTKLQEQISSMVPFNNLSVSFNENQQSTVATSFKEPLVLTKEMEVKESNWKDLVEEENNGHK